MKNISVIGLGYIGLPTSILAAQGGYSVFGFDVNSDKISKIKLGDPTIVEPEISERLLEVLQKKSLTVGNKIKKADCFVVAVPTPFTEDKKAELKYVFDSAKSISKVLKNGDLIILESTIPVGTTAKFSSYLENETLLKAGSDFFVAHCPERVLPGKIFQELVFNDRVIGGINLESAKKAKKFYSLFVKGEMVLTNDKTAEMVKLIENSSRDVQIAFANQVAEMAQSAGIEAREVIKLANKHPRVNILNPGCGVGGHCIAVDPWFLINDFPQCSTLLSQARNINDSRPKKIVKHVLFEIEKIQNIQKPKVLVLGVTFKADVDDIRQSPALQIAQELNNYRNELDLFVCEPNAKISDLGLEQVDLKRGLLVADVVVSLVFHKEFKNISFDDLQDKKVIDTCGLQYSIEKNQNIGFSKNQNSVNEIVLGG